MNKVKYLETLIDNLNSQVSDLKTNLNIHKEIVKNLLSENEHNEHNQIINDLFGEMLRIKENFADLNDEKNALDGK